MRRQFTAYTLVDPRDNVVFFAGYGRPSEPSLVIEHARKCAKGNQTTVRSTLAATLRDARIVDILNDDTEPEVRVLVTTEHRSEAQRAAVRAIEEHGLSLQRRERERRPCPTVGTPLTTKALALLLLLDRNAIYAMELVNEARVRWGVEVAPEAARVALIGLETGGYVESHKRPNDSLVGNPRIWYVLTDKGRRQAERVRETVRAVAA